jgi:hypothetical protein
MASAIRPVSASIPDRLRPYSPESRCIAIIVLVRTGIPPSNDQFLWMSLGEAA